MSDDTRSTPSPHEVLDAAVTPLRQAGLLDPRVADRVLVAAASVPASFELRGALPELLSAAGADEASSLRIEGAVIALEARSWAGGPPRRGTAPQPTMPTPATAPDAGAGLAADLAVARTDGPASRFDTTHIAYYLGAMCVLAGMGWGLGRAWDAAGGLFLALVAAAYGVAFAAFGERLWVRAETRHPAGLLWALAVGMVPLIVYGLQRQAGLWPDATAGRDLGYHEYYDIVNGRWVPMELATLAVGSVVARYRAIPFLGYPVAQALWFLGMDGLALAGIDRYDQKACLVVGVAMFALAVVVDRRARVDMAFWFHLAAALTLVAALRMWESNPLNAVGALALLALAAATTRQAYAVVGGIGLWIYVDALCFHTFEDSVLLPPALVVVGIASIAAGVWYQRHRERLIAGLRDALPEALQLEAPAR